MHVIHLDKTYKYIANLKIGMRGKHSRKSEEIQQETEMDNKELEGSKEVEEIQHEEDDRELR